MEKPRYIYTCMNKSCDAYSAEVEEGSFSDHPRCIECKQELMVLRRLKSHAS